MDKAYKHYCSLKAIPEQEIPFGIDEERCRRIGALNSKWINGIILTYYFFVEGEHAGSSKQIKLFKKAIKKWTKSCDIGLDLKEVDKAKDAIVRIGFNKEEGSWTYLGRCILDTEVVSRNKRTMNLATENDQTLNLCMHLIGHLLGLPNEHQNPTSGIKWNKDVVKKELSGPPNFWGQEQIEYNIFRLIEPDEMQQNYWDTESVMHFAFDKKIIKKPEKYRTTPLIPNDGLSETDIERVEMFYPKRIPSHSLKVDTPLSFTCEDGGQQRFYIELEKTTKVEIHTTGDCDAFMMLFQKQEDGSLMHLAFDDDSGSKKNCSIKYSLKAKTVYVLGIRLYWMNRKEVKEDIQLRMKVFRGRVKDSGFVGISTGGKSDSTLGGKSTKKTSASSKDDLAFVASDDEEDALEKEGGDANESKTGCCLIL